MAEKHPNPPMSGLTCAKWLLFLTFLHTIPSFLILPVAVGLVPAIFLLAAGVASLFSTDFDSLGLGAMFLAPAVLYAAVYYAVAWVTARIIFRCRQPSTRTAILFTVIGSLLGMAFLPVYSAGGHGGTQSGNIFIFIRMLPETDLSKYFTAAYTAGFISILLGLAACQHAPAQFSIWPEKWISARKLLRWTALVSLIGLLAAFAYVHRTLLIVRPLAQIGLTSAQVRLAEAMLESRGKRFPSKVSAREWLQRAAARGHIGAAKRLAALAHTAAEKEKWLKKAAERDVSAQYAIYSLLNKGKPRAERQDEAISWLKKAAANGHAQAQYQLGELYDRAPPALGGARDPEAARNWWERAAGHDNGLAMKELASRYAQGIDGFPRDPERSRELHARIAEGYEKGLYGFSPDEHLAAFWRKQVEKSADLERRVTSGDMDAQVTLGMQILRSRNPGPSGRKDGLALLEKAAIQGDAGVQYDLGAIYLFGNYGVEKDFEQAHRWFDLAAAQNHVRALQYMANGYLNGNYGYEVDLLKAGKWIERLIVGYRDGSFGVTPDKNQIRRWERERKHLQRLIDMAGGVYFPLDDLRRRSAAGDTRAQYQLARQMLVSGKAADRREGIRWLNRAADGGDPEAQYRLVTYYESIAHVMRDNPNRGVRLLNEAADACHPEAMATLAAAYEKGRYGLSRDFKQAEALYEELLFAYENDQLIKEVEEKFIDYQRWRLEVVERMLAFKSSPGD